MKRTALLLGVTVAVFTLFAGFTAVAAQETQTLTGEYMWTHRDSRGDLEAVFTATGAGTWDVSFHFRFRGEAHTYTGTAEGSLGEGALAGTVLNENKRRTFTFEGSFKNGTFQGTHAETTDGGSVRTGTLTLRG